MKRRPLIVSLILGIAVLAAIMLGVRSCRKPPAPLAPLSAAERTQARLAARMADPVYTNGLAQLAERQADLARLSNEAVREFEAWRVGFLASNAEARAVFDRIQGFAGKGLSPTNGLFAAEAAKFEALVASDPQSRYLLGKRDAIRRAIDEHQAVIADFIGGRIRRQRAEAATAEVAAMSARREQLLAEGKIKIPAFSAPTNRPAPRTREWPANAPSGSSGKAPDASGAQAEKTP